MMSIAMTALSPLGGEGWGEGLRGVAEQATFGLCGECSLRSYPSPDPLPQAERAFRDCYR